MHPSLAVKRRKLAWFGHVTRHDSPSKTILHGTFEGGQRKCWTDNVEEWTSLPMPEVLTRASCRKDWKRISAESFLMSPRRPNRSREWIELNFHRLLIWSLYSKHSPPLPNLAVRDDIIFWMSIEVPLVRLGSDIEFLKSQILEMKFSIFFPQW